CDVRLNLFFFSSRRRHTRSKRDWSSDVCSSDLERHIVVVLVLLVIVAVLLILLWCIGGGSRLETVVGDVEVFIQLESGRDDGDKIGRASCREREGDWG